ncbi:unnamed protein product, partial [Prorocentrum cordatum]
MYPDIFMAPSPDSCASTRTGSKMRRGCATCRQVRAWRHARDQEVPVGRGQRRAGAAVEQHPDRAQAARGGRQLVGELRRDGDAAADLPQSSAAAPRSPTSSTSHRVSRGGPAAIRRRERRGGRADAGGAGPPRRPAPRPAMRAL